MVTIDPRAVRREHLGEPVSPEVEQLSRSKPVIRQLSVVFHPSPLATVWTVVTLDRQGHRQWHRRIALGCLPSGTDALHGRELSEVLRILLREALDDLS